MVDDISSMDDIKAENAKADMRALRDEAKQLLQLTMEAQLESAKQRIHDIDVSLPHWLSREGFDPLITERQATMKSYYDSFGVYGLLFWLVQIAIFEAEDEHNHKEDPDSDSEESEVGDNGVPFDSDVEDNVPSINRFSASTSDGSSRVIPADDDGAADEAVDEASDHEDTCMPHCGRWPTASQRTGRSQVRGRTQAARSASSSSQRAASPSRMAAQYGTPSSDAPQGLASPQGTSLMASSPPREAEADQMSFPSAHESWKLILTDWVYNEGRVMLYYISSLHPKVIPGLINGDLPKLMCGAAFKREVGHTLAIQSRQGTYAVYVARQRQEANTAAEHKAQDALEGTSLTPRELLQVYEDMTNYIDVSNPGHRNLARGIDEARPGQQRLRNSLRYRSQRRYASGSNHDRFEQIKLFLEFLRLHYILWVEDKIDTNQAHLLDVPFTRCFVYVGLGRDVLQRCTQHWTNSGRLSPVLGLFCAVLQFRYPDCFHVKDSTFQIFKTIHWSHIGLDEKLTTLLLSAYPLDGGLSTYYAGINRGRAAQPSDDQRLRDMQSSRIEIETSDLQGLNLFESSLRIRQYIARVNNHMVLQDTLQGVVSEAPVVGAVASHIVQELESLSIDT